jgi:transposase, IS5 family
LKGYLSCWFGSELVVLLAGWRKNRLNRLWRNGLETPVLRTTNPQASLWEAILPAEVLGLPAELATVDRLLDDPAFIQPFRAHFDPTRGRPSVPLDTYLRLMFLKHRYGLGYELLCREVADSISWQRFCHIPLGGRVPHPTTLVKLTRRVGEQAVDGLNQALLHRAAEHRLLRTHKVRVDTTVVAANVAYPTDLGLLTRAVDKLATTVKRVQAAGGATRTRVRDRRRAARRRAHQVARAMRSCTDQAKQVVFEVTRQVAGLAEAQLADARRVVEGARRALARGRPQPTGRLRAVVEELQTTIEQTRRVLDQAHTRLAGGMPDGASRLVSLHDPDARPIRKGRLGRPVEFGYKAQVVDNADGIVLDHQVMVGNPPDAPLLAPAIGRVIARTGRAPRAVAADRGYGEARVDQELVDLGVARVAIPRRGRVGPARQVVERQRGFRRLVKWRTGCEGRISCLKHRFGWDRTRMDGIQGARIWCGHARVRPQPRQGRGATGSQAQQGSMNTRAQGQATTITRAAG